MAAMSNITLTLGQNQFVWTGRTPAGPDTPARWATGVFDATSRVGDAKLAFKYKRNGADTADQTKIDMVIPLPCNSQACGELVAAKAVMSIAITIPDAFDTTKRDWLVDCMLKTINTSLVSNAIKSGESFY